MTVPQILVVDDEELLRELVQACLEDLAGWETTTAASGEECLQLVQTKQFDAILLDVSMPRMDGYEVYERLQSNPMTRSIPVILLTAKVLPSERERFSRMDVAGVIAKPIEPIALTEAIAQMLGWDE
ncbi:MAG: response regulator [Coleofasciculaceae cyanobacterium]